VTFRENPLLNDFEPAHRRRIVDRRAALRLVGASGAAILLAPSGLLAATPPAPLQYLVFVDGKRSGTYTVEFVPRAQGFTAISAMSIRVEVAFITAYRYQQDGQEDWHDGKLVGFEYVTNDDGKTALVSAKRGDENFIVTGPKSPGSAPGETMASGFWNHGILAARQLVDPQTAELVPLIVRALGDKTAKIAGATVHGVEFSVETFLKGTVWYDAHRHLLASSFIQDGHKVELRRA
jgi:hypothetical protein